jgi:hypothetical protein
MDGIYLHYTMAEHAVLIEEDGFIMPSAGSGYAYLTRDMYPSGEEAKDKLALENTPNVRIVIHVFRAPDIGPRPVVEHVGKDGVRRKGGGTEYLFKGGLKFSGNIVITPLGK